MAIGGVALYVRTSSDDPENSGEAQLEVLKRFTRQNGMLVAKVFFQARHNQGTIDQMMAEATGDDHPFRLILATSHGQSQEFWQAKQLWRERLDQARVDIVSVPDPRKTLPRKTRLIPTQDTATSCTKGAITKAMNITGTDMPTTTPPSSVQPAAAP